jgi:hypothetical protein
MNPAAPVVMAGRWRYLIERRLRVECGGDSRNSHVTISKKARLPKNPRAAREVLSDRELLWLMDD